MLYQITTTQLRAMEAKWRSVINRFRGPIPGALGIAHLVALSNGNEDPTSRTVQDRPVGLMQIPTRIGQSYGYREADLKKPTNNIYSWAKKTNNDAIRLHQTYPTSWSTPNYDFWLTVHLYFLLGLNLSQLVLDTVADKTIDHVVSTIQQWIRNEMQPAVRFGRFGRTELRHIANHLDTVHTALLTLDGPDHPTEAFGSEITTNPGSTISVLGAAALRGNP